LDKRHNALITNRLHFRSIAWLPLSPICIPSERHHVPRSFRKSSRFCDPIDCAFLLDVLHPLSSSRTESIHSVSRTYISHARADCKSVFLWL